MTNQAELDQAKADFHTAASSALVAIETFAKAAKEAVLGLLDKASVATPTPAPVAPATEQTVPVVVEASVSPPSDTPAAV